ncbi:MAG TPA: hypothetical protein VJU59_05375, partial [Paraburkholderia sp.]|uniref:hypothetical protein n=1 Tax=Paraburkholderia sp. TaxID=1926495 RepID=UPI002B4968E4
MASVVARFDRGERVVFGQHVFGRRAAIAGVVAGVLALHAALIAVARWETPASHAMPVRVRVVEAVLIAPESHKSEAPARTSLPSRSIHEAIRSNPVQPARTRPAAPVHAETSIRTTPPPAAAPAVRAAPEAAMPTERIAGPQPQPQPQPAPVAQAPAADTPRRVAHLDCALTKPDYPAQSLRRAEAGTAMIELETAADGHVVAARVATTSGYARL